MKKILKPLFNFRIFLSIEFIFASFVGAGASAQIKSSAENYSEQRGDISLDLSPAPETSNRFNLSYFGVLYGPSLQKPSSSQPTADSRIDPELPLSVLNFMGLGYNLNERYALMATASWDWQPVRDHVTNLRDPFLKFSDSALIMTEQFSLYADGRIHFPVTEASREADLLSGLQSFFIANFQPYDSRFSLGTFLSGRYNVFGSQGVGNDVELYAGPYVNYQISPRLALTCLYEMGANHIFRNQPLRLENAGTDLEPGIRWDPTPQLSINPYLNFFTGDQLTLASTSIGMTVAWQLM